MDLMSGLDLSHFGTDALDQWERVIRWHERLTPFRTAFPEQEPARSYALDDVWAFFMNCYHLRDWLIRAGVKSQKEVDSFIDQSQAMRLCRDVANGVKHYKLNPRKPTTTNANWTTMTYYTYTGREGEALREHAHRVFLPDQAKRFKVTAARDVFEVADACMTAWRGFLNIGAGQRHPRGLKIGPH
jgi:hypothetical protein